MATAPNTIETDQKGTECHSNNDKWYHRLQTEYFFEKVFSNIDESNPSYGALLNYSKLGWLPKLNNESCYTVTEESLKQYIDKNEDIKKKWNLLDDNDFYKRISKDKQHIHIDVCWKRSWFSALGLNVPDKHYFWRASYWNDEWGKTNSVQHGKIMVARLNLAYVAWRQCVSTFPNPVSVPIIVFTKHIPGMKGRTKWPQWKFVKVVPKKNKTSNVIAACDIQNAGDSTLEPFKGRIGNKNA